MTETDLRLLGAVLREARDLALDCCCAWDTGFADDIPNGEKLLDALDQLKFKASFQVPE